MKPITPPSSSPRQQNFTIDQIRDQKLRDQKSFNFDRDVYQRPRRTVSAPCKRAQKTFKQTILNCAKKPAGKITKLGIYLCDKLFGPPWLGSTRAQRLTTHLDMKKPYGAITALMYGVAAVQTVPIVLVTGLLISPLFFINRNRYLNILTYTAFASLLPYFALHWVLDLSWMAGVLAIAGIAGFIGGLFGTIPAAWDAYQAYRQPPKTPLPSPIPAADEPLLNPWV